jgi:hypothetical protein
MSQRRREDACRSEAPAPSPPTPAAPAASGIVRRDEFDAELAGETPPWEVVYAYLSRGEHHAWVEAHAERSRAFAEVLAALRNDHEERREARRRR